MIREEIPLVDMRSFKVESQALALVPEEIARENKVLPISADQHTITLAMESPGDLKMIDLVGFVEILNNLILKTLTIPAKNIKTIAFNA